mmetsp:Transcript_63800/g.138778  ORF Transcript_63800/g.138778 Transcript_63800/m.138778 type:complete len:143 (+) Transcript_63800:1-429(+)|eukprot:CAMPEP_0175808324 /NCGR_PEP_ID=MMETSP0107_2-20121207/2196_1 /TAXON_ID=195067 ORGANISM="Goniomonas pacifica, Strain CCMP1869" /NCGR_SAMPLE_ID=MMETSP0107_2 /ASSEMBLY_ACC=CAM_ASM_000203 /LENGTH=142 /DNA_ID=CAMNT_0017119939 /DNA_START=1 /DNA_END=429 /DNA_ORIENTATION=-
MADFDALLSVESECVRQGRAEAELLVNKGEMEIAGAQESEETGILHGTSIGLEMGYYGGYAEAWLALSKRSLAQPPLSERNLKSCRQLLAIVELIGAASPEAADFMDHVGDARARFKQLSSSLGSIATFQTTQTTASTDLDF